jgi:Putative metal-binding motif
MKSGWSWGGVAAVLGSLLVGGCDGSTGVLIEVTRGDSVAADVGRLAFHVGVDGMIAGQPRSYVDPTPEPDVRLDGRDLAEEPYRLMIRPRDHEDAEVMVAVVAYSGGDVVGFGALEQPVGFVDGEVAMWRITLQSGLPGGFENGDTGCVAWVDGGGELVTIGRPRDEDCDGWADDDCNDLDPGINPGASESCGNAVDEDCDAQIDEDVDEDADQVTTCGGDCDDHDGSVSPLAAEECDGADNDCDGTCDEELDADGDGYTACGSKLIEGGSQCLFDPSRPDCDDFNDKAYPGAVEGCDGVDNDCNQVCDDSSAGLDRDGDRFTSCGSITDECGRSDGHRD